MDPTVITVCTNCPKAFVHRHLLDDPCVGGLAANDDLVGTRPTRPGHSYLWQRCALCTQQHVVLPICFEAFRLVDAAGVPHSEGDRAIARAQRQWIDAMAKGSFGLEFRDIAAAHGVQCSRELLCIVGEFLMNSGRFKRSTSVDPETGEFRFEAWSASAELFADLVYRSAEPSRKRARNA